MILVRSFTDTNMILAIPKPPISNENKPITNPPAPNDKLKEAAATHLKKYTDKDMTNFVSFVGKNYIKAKGFYFMKGDFEKKHKLSIHQILEEFKKKNLEVKK